MTNFLSRASLVLVLSFAGTIASAKGGCAIAGPDTARITIQEFSDFHCPYCKRGSNTMREVLKLYPSQVKLVFRNMPLPFHDPGATQAAKALTAICRQSPSLAYAFQEELFARQDRLVDEGDKFLFETARKIGADEALMKTDMETEAVSQSLAADKKLAATHGINGTPSFLIGTELVAGSLPLADFKRIIDKQLGR